MSNDLKNILSNLNKDVEQEKLLEYLNRQLTPEEQHELEAHLNDDPFMSDAMDGLSEMKGADKISLMVYQLNKDLKQQLDKKKKKKKRAITETPWLYYTAII
ncbi:MAG: zf-HC2 domain-containing protein, partial [Sphingobacteriales bacterium]